MLKSLHRRLPRWIAFRAMRAKDQWINCVLLSTSSADLIGIKVAKTLQDVYHRSS
jgi:hypothetical protein